MTYAEAIQFLHSLQMFGMNPGLETTQRLAALAGNPQAKLRFIHVAGTNGKGSTCAILESIYLAAGLKVGLYTSPHLVSFRERIQINRGLIPQAEVVRLVTELRPRLAAFSKEHHPTFFEVVTVMALQYFAEQQCDLVIWETGLGGRLDATNIVTPLASVITNIGFDHEKWLGDTLAKIAAEKAGIIKPGVPVLTAAEEPEALAVIEATAQQRQALLTRIQPPTELLDVSLAGAHQQKNAALALATVQALQSQIPVAADAIRTGIASVVWPGRFQIVNRKGASVKRDGELVQLDGQTVVIDGAHNPDGAAVLAATWQQQFPGVRPALILGMMADKDCAKFCGILAPLSDEIYLVPVASERRAFPAELAWHCRQANPAAQLQMCGGLGESLLNQLRPLVSPGRFILITGSLYLVGEALEFLGFADACDERGLNDWKPASDPSNLR